MRPGILFNKPMQLTHIVIHTKKIGLEWVMLPKFWCFVIPGHLMLKKTSVYYLNAFILGTIVKLRAV